MDKVINNQRKASRSTKKAPRRQSHWPLCQMPDTLQENWSDWSPRVPLGAKEGHCLWNEWPCYISLLTMPVGIVTGPKCCSDSRLTPSLLCCSHLPSAHECGDIPPALLWDRGGSLDRGWGTTAQWGAEAGAAPPPWVTTASSMASCKLDPDVSGNREKEEPTENFHMFWVVFLAIKMLQHDHGQNPDLQGNG